MFFPIGRTNVAKDDVYRRVKINTWTGEGSHLLLNVNRTGLCGKTNNPNRRNGRNCIHEIIAPAFTPSIVRNGPAHSIRDEKLIISEFYFQHSNVFTVSASDKDGNLADFSNYGSPPIDLCFRLNRAENKGEVDP